ncbi:MAG: phosphopantetheine-binding protein [Clostridia bacterium]|nr:phosphopantetheine-binding protein [Clostridia bacterium]
MFEKLKKMVIDYIDYDENAITPETEILRDLEMTSYDIVTMIGELENEFGITMDEDEIKEIVTLGDLAAYITKKL